MIGLTNKKLNFIPKDEDCLFVNRTSGDAITQAQIKIVFPEYQSSKTEMNKIYISSAQIPYKFRVVKNNVNYDALFSWNGSETEQHYYFDPNQLKDEHGNHLPDTGDQWSIVFYPQSAFLFEGKTYDYSEIYIGNEGDNNLTKRKIPGYKIHGKDVFLLKNLDTEKDGNYQEKKKDLKLGFLSSFGKLNFDNCVYKPIYSGSGDIPYNSGIISTSYRKPYLVDDLLALEDRECLELERVNENQFKINIYKWGLTQLGKELYNFGSVVTEESGTYIFEDNHSIPSEDDIFIKKLIGSKTFNLNENTHYLLIATVEPTNNEKNVSWIDYTSSFKGGSLSANNKILKGGKTKLIVIDTTQVSNNEKITINFITPKIGLRLVSRISGWNNFDFKIYQTEHYIYYQINPIASQLKTFNGKQLGYEINIVEKNENYYILPNLSYPKKYLETDSFKLTPDKVKINYTVKSPEDKCNLETQWTTPQIKYEIPLFYSLLNTTNKFKFFYNKWMCEECNNALDSDFVSESGTILTGGCHANSRAFHGIRPLADYRGTSKNSFRVFEHYLVPKYNNKVINNIPGLGDFYLKNNINLMTFLGAQNKTRSPWWLRWDINSPIRMICRDKKSSPYHILYNSVNENSLLEQIYNIKPNDRAEKDSFRLDKITANDLSFRELGDMIQNMWGSNLWGYGFYYFTQNREYFYRMEIFSMDSKIFQPKVEWDNSWTTFLYYWGQGGVYDFNYRANGNSGFKRESSGWFGGDDYRTWYVIQPKAKRNSSSLALDWKDNNEVWHNYFTHNRDGVLVERENVSDNDYYDRNAMYNPSSNVAGAVALFIVEKN